MAGDKVFKVCQLGDKFEYANIDQKFVEHYFGLNDDLEKIADNIRKDRHIAKALKEYWGLRLIRQDPWECLISYICATYKSIAAIKHMLNNIAQKFGKKVSFDGHDFYTFPTSEDLAKATEKELASCGLGYRSKYAQATSKRIYEE